MRDQARNYGFQSNKELMLYLKDSGYIRSNFIFEIMCSVDRKNFTTNKCTSYRDRPEPVAFEKTISAPHMHAEVLEQMSESLRQGKCALDIGSGSGYLTICMALALGEKGKVIGVDCIPGFQIMANQIAQDHYPGLLQNDRVEYIVYDGRRGWPWGGPYDAIHVGVAAESIPEALIEQLAPGGCLVMPVGSGEYQVLVSLKKSLNRDFQKKELMKVRYGTFTEVDLPWSSMVGNDLIAHQEIRNQNTLTSKSQANNTPINELFVKESIKKSIETTQTDKEAENKTLENINGNINKNRTDKDTHLLKPIEKIQCSLPNKIKNDTNERKTVPEKIQIFGNKDDREKPISQEDPIISIKLDPKIALTGDPDKITDLINTKAANVDENLKIILLNEDGNDTNDLDKKTLTENMTMYKSVLQLECTSPETIQGNENAHTVNNNNSDDSEKGIAELERNNCDFEASKSQETDSFSEDSDEVSSVDTQIDTQAFYEDCRNCDEMPDSIQSNPNVYISSKSFSKSLENFSTINEPVSKLRSSVSTIIGSVKYKTQNVREKIELFEKNIQNGKTLSSQENITIKIKSTPKENKNASVKDINENNQVLENSKNNEVLRAKIDESLLISQPNCSTILNSDKTETVQQEINNDQENTEKNQNDNEQIVKKEQNQYSGENVEKASHESISSEFKLFKNEIRVMLNDFLSSEKENHEEIKLRQVNLHINRIHQVQLANNHDEKVDSVSQNFEQNGKPYENLEHYIVNKKLSAENQDEHSDDLQMQMRNITEKVEQLQAQFDNNIGKLLATNEELKGRINHYENLENRLHNLEKKFKLMTQVLAKLIDKTNCHGKILSIQLSITEKEEASRVLEKLKREQTEEKIDNVISAIFRIAQEVKATSSKFVDNITKDNDEQYCKPSGPTSNAYISDSESFLTELNLIKSLLHLGKENPVAKKKSLSNNEGESTDNVSEMDLLKIILEEN